MSSSRKNTTNNLPLTKKSGHEPFPYRDLFAHAPIGIVRTTVEGRLLEANRAFYRLLGFDSEGDAGEIHDIASDIYVDPPSRENLINLLKKHSTANHFPVQFKGKNNRHINCHLHVRAVTNEAGSIEYLEGFIDNVDLQVKTRKALEESEARYRSIFENTGAGTIIIEEDTTISMANSGFYKLFGFRREDVECKMKWPEFIADEKQREMMLAYHYKRRKNPGDAPVEYEFSLRDNYGRLRDIYLRVDMIGETTSSVASLFDITSLKTACRHLNTSESKLAGIVEAFDGYIYTRSKDYRLTYMNTSLQKLYGDGAINQPCYQVLYQFDKPCKWCPHELVFEGKTVKAEFQHPHTGRWYYTVSSSIYDVESGEAESQTVLVDIHERKETELQLKEKEAFLERENHRLKATIKERYRFGSIIGKSREMQKLYEFILRAAASEASVIIYGESGTGKELVARAIHDLSFRAKGNFIPVNCSAVPGELMESEFFGYVKGAFTGAIKDKKGYFDLAAGGTLFLDELGDISGKLQVKLLRALEGGGYSPVGGQDRRKANVRIIGATNRNLGSLIEQGKMREDFFYRIHILPIHLPPLRDRREDIPLLIEHFFRKFQPKTTIPTLPGRDIERLMTHSWPGNVRELKNTIQRYIDLGYLEFTGNHGQIVGPEPLVKAPQEIRSLSQAVADFEREYLVQLLSTNQWNRTKVASLLKIQRKTLYLKMKRLGIKERKGYERISK